jgi:hypothetical protein
VLVGLVSFAVIGSAVWWAVSPGTHIKTVLAVSPASAGVVQFGDLAEDDGMPELLATYFEGAERANPGSPDMPSWLRDMMRGNRANGFKQWLPREGTLSLERTADGALHHVAALNLRTYVRPMRLFFEKMADDRVSRKSQHRGETLIALPGGTTVCFAGGTLLVSDEADLVRAVLDREAAAPAVPPTLPPDAVPRGWDVSGTMRDAEAAALLLARLVPETSEVALGESPRPVQARFGIDAKPRDRLRGMLELSFATAADAAAAMPWMERNVADLRGRAAAENVPFEASLKTDGLRIVLEVEGTGLAAAAGRNAARVSHRRRRSTGF